MASREKKSDRRQYVCDCPERHRVFLRRGDKLLREPHFAHFPVYGPEGKQVIHECRGGGESEEHKSAKHKLVEMQGQYSFEMERCCECGRRVVEDCEDGRMGIETRSTDRKWWYDVSLTKADGRMIALEVYHTHETTAEKIRSSLADGVVVAEFRSEDILALEPGGTLKNLQVREGFCSDGCREASGRREAERRRRVEEARLHALEIQRHKAEQARLHAIWVQKEEAEKARLRKERADQEARLWAEKNKQTEMERQQKGVLRRIQSEIEHARWWELKAEMEEAAWLRSTVMRGWQQYGAYRGQTTREKELNLFLSFEHDKEQRQAQRELRELHAEPKRARLL